MASASSVSKAESHLKPRSKPWHFPLTARSCGRKQRQMMVHSSGGADGPSVHPRFCALRGHYPHSRLSSWILEMPFGPHLRWALAEHARQPGKPTDEQRRRRKCDSDTKPERPHFPLRNTLGEAKCVNRIMIYYNETKS